MYNQYVLSLLKEINRLDCNHSVSDAQITIQVGEAQQQVIIYYWEKRYYFKAIGSPYLLAMAKWLKEKLQQNQSLELENYTIIDLVSQFSLPQHKRKDGLLILQLIEQWNGR